MPAASTIAIATTVSKAHSRESIKMIFPLLRLFSCTARAGMNAVSTTAVTGNRIPSMAYAGSSKKETDEDRRYPRT